LFGDRRCALAIARHWSRMLSTHLSTQTL
jgi:hypothetical protein